MAVRERVVAVLAALVTASGWIVVVLDPSDGGIGTGVVLWIGGLALGVVVAALNRTLSDGNMPDVAVAATTVSRSDPLIDQGRSFGLPGLWVRLSPLALGVPMLIWLPFTPEVRGGDWSIALGLLFFVALLGAFGLLAGIVVWLMIGLPVIALIVAFGPNGDPASRRLSTGITGIFWSILALAVLIVTGAPDLSADTDDAQHAQFLALFGVDESAVVHPVLLWTARGCLVVLVVSIVVTLRGRRMRARRTA